ncbi:MAG: hypothetical protein DRI34_03840 [Deltaproteobacteria bacterium]|nr:MAG: hypothetical protein DRI34_03840 [Deltaproteobacteria bacterium]
MLLASFTMLLALPGLVPPAARAQTLVHQQTFDGSISPWSETTIGSDYNIYPDWSVVSSGSSPSCSPRQGSHMVEFNSSIADSGAEARISSPALDLTGAEVAECRLWMYHDGDYSSYNDRVYFQLSSDSGEHFYTVVTLYRTDGSGWTEHVIPLGQYTNLADARVALRGRSSGGNNIYIDDVRLYKDILPAGVEGKGCSSGGDCNSGICSPDPGGAGRCRDDLSGHDCIDGNRVAVAAGTVTCYRGDVATCSAVDTWSVQSCFDDCGAYLDVHACEEGQCVDCDDFACFVIGDEGCDPDAYCDPTFGFMGVCKFQKQNGESCSENKHCLSGNCAPAPDGQKFCEDPGACAATDGGAVGDGQQLCYSGDLYTCQGGLWSGQDCYSNCGIYADVDDCQQGACLQCATTCNDDQDCKQGIPCVDNQCVGDLPNGQTCNSDTQCQSSHCIDGVCCADICTAPCHRCDVAGSPGTCTPVPAGQDPDGECSGQGLCAGSCDGQGGCQYPGPLTVCDVCVRCDNAGHCASFVAANSDPLDECPPCQVCSGSGPGCVPAAAGSDPLDECPEQPASSCGGDGQCDGQGACRLWPAGTVCGAGSCADGQAELPDQCDGQGSCLDGGSASCGLYKCADASACADSCSGHLQCQPQAFCDAGGQCQPDRGDGASCQDVWPGQDGAAACLGGHCLADNFDGSGAFCSSDPSLCMHDGSGFAPGYVLCIDDTSYRFCQGGAAGWSEVQACSAGPCDAGGGPGSGYRTSGGCTSGAGGGCRSECVSCEPYRAGPAGCLGSCTNESDCWSGYQCQAGSCGLPEGIGSPCQQQADCVNGYCSDGVCCLEACTGPCRSCNQAGHEGLCRPSAAGSDPDNECPASEQSSCGTTGVCDGQGACQLWPAGSECAPARCQDNLLLGAASCNGAGDCVTSGTVDCSPGRCLQGACVDTCSSHDDCQPQAFCSAAGTCQPDLADGQSCENVVLAGLEADAACSGGFCRPDDWSGSGAICSSDEIGCVAAGEIFPPGYRRCQDDSYYRVCLGGRLGWGAESECRPAGFCDAGGGPGSGVTAAETCSSGPQGGCSSECSSCAPYMAAGPGSCSSNCSEDSDCWPGFSCQSGLCQAPADLGQACQQDGDCSGGLLCRDAVCCNLSCDGPCRSCADARGPGLCLFSRAGTDPHDDCQPGEETCSETGSCDGQGACALAAAGTTCAGASCSAGVYTSPSFCDGRGQCQPGLEHQCASGRCQQDRCAPGGQQPDGVDGGDGGDGGSDGGVYDGPPLAEAGPDQVVEPATTVTLDGSGSRGQNLTFLWEQSSGPEQAALQGSTTARPSFLAGREGVYVFRLVVSDDSERRSEPDFTQVLVVAGGGGCSCSSTSPIPPPGAVLLLLLLGLGLYGRGRRPR